jgi:hypothetical protein
MLRMAIQTSRFRIGVLCMHTLTRPLRWIVAVALQAKLRCISSCKCLWPDDVARISGFGMASARAMAFFAAPPLRASFRPRRLAMWILGKASANFFVAAHADFRAHVLRRVFRRWRFVLRRGKQRHAGKHQGHPPKLKLRHHFGVRIKRLRIQNHFPELLALFQPFMGGCGVTQRKALVHHGLQLAAEDMPEHLMKITHGAHERTQK